MGSAVLEIVNVILTHVNATVSWFTSGSAGPIPL